MILENAYALVNEITNLRFQLINANTY